MAVIPQAALAAHPWEVYTHAMKSVADRVLLFSSIGHGLMHLMTAFYAVIVLILAAVWQLPVETLLELYAPATRAFGRHLAAGRLGVRQVRRAGHDGGDVRRHGSVVDTACGLVQAGDTLALSISLCGVGAFGAISMRSPSAG